MKTTGVMVLMMSLCAAVARFADAQILSTNVGPYSGGNTITITNGSFGNITNVLVGGGTAPNQSSGTNWVTFTIPGGLTPGVQDIVIQTSDQGDTTLPNAYTVNPAGEIVVFPDWSRWQEMAGLPAARYLHAAAVLNGALYAVGGRDDSGTTVNNVYRYDGTNWTEVGGLPGARRNLAAAVLNGALYAVGGIDDIWAVSTNVFRYNGTNWTEMAGLPGARSYHAAAVLNDVLYAVGGIDDTWAVSTNVFRYNGTNWTEMAGLPSARYGLAVGALDGALYAVGGLDTHSAAKTNAYRYNGTSWTEMAGLPAACYGLAVGVLDGALYAVGGLNSANMQSTNVYRYNGTNWTETAGLPGARGSHAAGVLNGELYAVGGLDTNGVTMTNVFRYPFRAEYVGVSPSSGSCAGGYQVVIAGLNLGDGGDITNVTLCGATATIQSGQLTTQIVVVAGVSSSAILGDVRVFSTSFGETVSSNAFTYLHENQAPLGFSPTTPQFYGTTNALSVTGGSGTGAVSYTVLSGPGLIVGGTQLTVTNGSGTISVRATKAQDDLFYEASVTSSVVAAKANQSGLTFIPADPQTYNTTNGLSASGGGSSGGWTFSVISGTAQIVGGTNLWMRTGTGSVTVRATKAGDANWNSAYVEATVNAAKAGQTITFPAIADKLTTNRVGLAASATSGLSVSFATNGGPAVIAGGTNLTFTTAGSVSIVASQAGNTNWSAAPNVTNTFNVTKAVAIVTLTNLTQTYDGTARVVGFTSVPSVASVLFTYDGSGSAPTDVGTYSVTGVVNDLIYEGGAVGTLTVSKGDQTINFALIPNQRPTNIVHLAATASSGLPVTFAVVSGPAVLTNGTDLSFSDHGEVTVRASQAGDANWNSVLTEQSFRVGSCEILDFDGDGITDLGVFRASNDTWYVYRSTEGELTPFQYGIAGDIPIPADYDGDGFCDVAVFRPSTATWYIFGSSKGPVTPFAYGAPGDRPIPADYDGDGLCDVAVFRPSTATWYIFGSTKGPMTPFAYGAPGDRPIPADYDGDGLCDIAVFRPSTAMWYIFGSAEGSVTPFAYGAPGDWPVPGDYDGDGLCDVAVFRPSTAMWYIFGSTEGPFDPFAYGVGGDTPLIFP